MRNGYILLHRKGITPEEWKHPRRTLAWIDLLTLTNYEDGIVTASYGFLADRWRVSKHTAYDWMQHFVGERQLERKGERDGERNGERWFVVNYAKYQGGEERIGEREGERRRERKGEPKKEVISTKSEEPSHEYGGVPPLSPADEVRQFFADATVRQETVRVFAAKGMPADLAASEIEKFRLYWTEPTKSGRKQRWETEKTFEIRRRLITWMDRVVNRPRPVGQKQALSADF